MQREHDTAVQMEMALSSSQEIWGAVSQVSTLHGRSGLLMRTPRLPSLASWQVVFPSLAYWTICSPCHRHRSSHWSQALSFFPLRTFSRLGVGLLFYEPLWSGSHQKLCGGECSSFWCCLWCPRLSVHLYPSASHLIDGDHCLQVYLCILLRGHPGISSQSLA